MRIRGNSIQIDFSYKGVRCRETLKIKPTKENIRFANRKKEAISYDMAVGRFNYLEHFPGSAKAMAFSEFSGSGVTIECALKEWLKKAERRCAQSTIRDYNSAVYHHLIPEFGKKNLSDLKSNDVNEWMLSLVNISPKRINNILTPLRQTYLEAYCEEVIERNPMDRVRNLPRRTREPQPFAKNEISKILSKLEGQSKNIIQFAFATGLRTSELIGLRWEDYDGDRKCIHIRRAVVRGHEKVTKTVSGERTVQLSKQALEAIDAQRFFTEEIGDRVFHDGRDNEPKLTDQNIRKIIWMPALKAAGIAYRTPYQTRHTFASMMLSEGKNPLWVSNQLGHVNPSQTFKSYARWIKSDYEIIL